jgi:ribonuclease HI
MPYRMFPRKNRERRPSEELFVGTEPPPQRFWTAHVDGGARGNPGPAGYGVVLENEAGHQIAQSSKFLGIQTNNYAEYSGLLAALEQALANGCRALKVMSDSELLVRQIRGQYKVRHPVLQELHAKAKKLITQFEWFDIEHVRREQNRDADRLANLAMDQGETRRL